MTSKPDPRQPGRAFWFGPLDVTADPTGTMPPTIDVTAARGMSPADARRASAHLIAAADYCEEARRG